MPTDEEILRVRDDRGRKRPYQEFREDAKRLGWRPDQQIRLIHQRRSHAAKVADQSFRAVDTREMPTGAITAGEKRDAQRTVRAYYKNTNRVDVEGIDTVKEEYKRERVERAKQRFEEGGLIKGVVEGAKLGHAAAEFSPSQKEIRMDRDATRDRTETLAHELGHALDHRLAGPAVRGFGYSSTIHDEDDEFREQVREASVQRRGAFSDHDEYRSTPTEQFADWAVQAIHHPRHTKATKPAGQRAAEEGARQRGKERLDKLVETPLNATRSDVHNEIYEAAREADKLEDDAVWDLEEEIKKEVRLRFETEGHREQLEERAEERKQELEGFSASTFGDFASLRLGDIDIESDPLFEGSRRADLLPEDKVQQVEAELGQPLDITGRD